MTLVSVLKHPPKGNMRDRKRYPIKLHLQSLGTRSGLRCDSHETLGVSKTH